MVETTADNRCKGIVFTSFVHVLEKIKGREVVSATLARESVREVSDVLRHGGLVKGAWYPLSWYRALHEAALAETRDTTLARAIGRISTRNDLASGFARFITSVLSPQFLIGASSKVFNRYYEVGTMRIAESRAGYARATWTGCFGFDRAIWQDVLGGCEGAFDAGGAKEMHGRILSGGEDGDTGAVFEASWK